MEYSYDSHSYLPSRAKHDSFLQPSSRDVNGYSRTSRSSTRLGVPHDDSVSRNKSVGERERRPYHTEPEYRSRSSVRREETYPQTAPRAKSARRRRSRSRGGYPPSPSVEDENEAVRKEHPQRRIPRQKSDEVLMPGTINQDPIMIELENHDRRYVYVPYDETKASKPDSRRPRRPSDRVPPLKTDLEEPDLLARRKPSPYAFSSTPQSSTSGSRSSDASSRQPARTSSRRDPVMTPPTSEDESRRRPRTSRPTNSSSDERNTSDSDIDPATAAKMRDRKSKPRVSFHEPSLSPRPEVKRFSSDFGSPQDGRPKAPGGGPSLLKSALKPTASTRSSDDEAPRRRIDANAIPMPRSVPGVIPLPQHMREESGYGNRPTLQELTEAERARDSRSTYPPAGSPRVISQPSPHDYYSATGQPLRSSSPATSSYDARDFPNNAPPTRSNGYSDSENGYGSGSERRNHADRRRRPHSRQGSLDSVDSSRNDGPLPPPTPSSALPYPVDDSMMLMPNHEHYIDTPTRETAPQVAMPTFPIQDYTASPVSSPNLSRNSAEFSSQSHARSHATSRGPPAPHETASSFPPRALPPCPRMGPVKGYTDWYTLIANDNIDVCPTCFDGIIRSSPFRKKFKLSAPRRPDVGTACDFGSPWYRAAWLLTLKRGRQDLQLVEALAAISTFDKDCPGSRIGAGPWYGLLSSDGAPVPGFSVCSRDFIYIEALFPALIGLFHRLPGSTSSHDARKCSMRVASDRFEDYLNFLEKIDEEARTMDLDKTPTLKKFSNFIRGIPPASPPSTSSTKCAKDKYLRDATWHYMPALPEFTICESCFDDVIWPDVKTGSELASQFHQVLTPLPAGIHTKGTSCQLYSDRMRYLWAQLVKKAEKDGQREALKVLARKVRQRWEIEGEIRAERRKVEDKLERNRKNVGRLAEDIKKDCWRRLQDLDEDWSKWE